MLVPGSPERPVQFLDARDLASWIIEGCEARRTGVFDATGPDRPFTMGAFLEACSLGSVTPARPVWVGEEFPLHHGLAPYADLPLWLPAATHPHANEVASLRARACGLAPRAPSLTIKDTATWDAGRGSVPLAAGLDVAEERRLLSEWGSRKEPPPS